MTSTNTLLSIRDSNLASYNHTQNLQKSSPFDIIVGCLSKCRAAISSSVVGDRERFRAFSAGLTLGILELSFTDRAARKARHRKITIGIRRCWDKFFVIR